MRWRVLAGDAHAAVKRLKRVDSNYRVLWLTPPLLLSLVVDERHVRPVDPREAAFAAAISCHQ